MEVRSENGQEGWVANAGHGRRRSQENCEQMRDVNCLEI